MERCQSIPIAGDVYVAPVSCRGHTALLLQATGARFLKIPCDGSSFTLSCRMKT